MKLNLKLNKFKSFHTFNFKIIIRGISIFLILLVILLALFGCVGGYKNNFVVNNYKISDSKVNNSKVDNTTVNGFKVNDSKVDDSTRDSSKANDSKVDDSTLNDSRIYINVTNNDTNNNVNNNIIFTFTVCGDNRPADDYLPQPEVFKKIIGLIKEQNPAFHLSVGDIINGQTTDENVIKRQFQDYLDVVEQLSIINFVSPGNHDLSNDTTRKYFSERINKKTFIEAKLNGIQIYTFSDSNANQDYKLNKSGNQDYAGNSFSFYYYFEYKGVYFIILNAFEKGYWGAIKGGQLKWLEKVLKNLSNQKVFIFIHTPVYSVLNPETITDGSKHVAFSSKKNLDYIRELFKNYNVDGVFSGHEHLYNRQFHEGTTYIITALSGEYPFVSEEEGGIYHFIKVEVKENSWIFYVIDKNNKIYYQEEVVFN